MTHTQLGRKAGRTILRGNSLELFEERPLSDAEWWNGVGTVLEVAERVSGTPLIGVIEGDRTVLVTPYA